MTRSGMVAVKRNSSIQARARYRPPEVVHTISLPVLLTEIGRPPLKTQQLDLLRSQGGSDAKLYFAGNIGLLSYPAVSIVGTRDVSESGWRRACRLAKELAQAGIVVVSGLARGVDTAAMTCAIEAGGNTVGVIGTPLNKAYPSENAGLQEAVAREHLLLSPFRAGEAVFKGNFPKRNRVMAAITDATVIIEASDTSGTLHQAAECCRLGRWLFIAKSVVDDSRLTWPSGFINEPNVAVLSSTQDILDVVRQQRA